MSIANAIKSFGASVTTSEGDIRHKLKNDHDQFRACTKLMVEATRTAERVKAFAQLRPSLAAHASIEEKIVYDAIIGSGKDKASSILGREGYVEHQLVDHLLQRFAKIDPSTDKWIALAKVLRKLLGHHIDEEESDTFAKLGENFSREALNSMGEQFEQQKGRLLLMARAVGAQSTKKTKKLADRASPRVLKASKARPEKASAKKTKLLRKR